MKANEYGTPVDSDGLADRFTTLYRKHKINSCRENTSNLPLALHQLLKDIRSPSNRLLRMWGNRKSPTLRSEMPTNFILPPHETKPTIHHPLVVQRPIQPTFKMKNRSSHQIPCDQRIPN
ncbi:hypothetical protein AVEN_251783-1 [Araneus ventricosus]|uniref:Uncharacterized protein n=1 Tax=Araneus ventricosus TaxID=182803 RepID=A0A4Y2NC61_ARAVE|nr:hypothetical protein AVEN_251783-1 [Araneus ventricosus]